MKILFVCLGNICRSPMAEAVFLHKVNTSGLAYTADSAGTGNWHAGEQPDRRTLKILSNYGIDTKHRARQVTVDDFHHFDLIIAMDQSNLEHLKTLQAALPNASARLHLMREFDTAAAGEDVPDPYWSDLSGFEDVYNILNTSLEGLLAHLKAGN